jgi:hypothetical protein
MGLVAGLKKIAGFGRQVGAFVETAKFFLSVIEKIDDDTDGDGKSQLENIWEKIEKLEQKVVGNVMAGLGRAKFVFDDCVADGKVIIGDIEALRKHVMEKA